MQITDIKIRKTFTESTLRAVVSVTFDDALAVHDIKIIYAKEKFFLIMPSKKNAEGNYKDIVHPINSFFRSMLEKSVIEAYNKYLEEAELHAAAAEAEQVLSEEEMLKI